MKLMKCPNGHFYDGEKYQSCPHCEGRGRSESDATVGTTDAGIAVTEEKNSLDDTSSIGRDTIEQLQKRVDQRGDSQDDDEKTVGLDYLKGPSEENGEKEQRIRPVVGWLVGICGAGRGKSFPIYGGQNYIGRSERMDICLKGDPAISKNRHAIVIYDPKHRSYFACPGESSQLYYINGQVVLSACQLQDRDVLEIGNSQFLFVPFCDSRFSWDTPVPVKAGL